ncbi:MAG: protein phosphatase 2C domain-containing protein [Acidobacteria bacterium]|nr:protein phosphatase 2C domain-containing protein [Acidobacteriota bacterium]
MRGNAGKSGRSRQFKFGLYGYVSDRGLNPKRVTNEDSYLLLQDVPLFAVADGVGGQNAGEVASQVTVELLKTQFLKKRIPTEKIQFLEQVVCYANRYLYDMAVDDEVLSGMATTLAVLLLERKRATLCHVGDSRIYRFTAGKLYRETIDHSLSEDSRFGHHLESEPINKSIITRALGVEPDVVPETKAIPIPPDTTFLLCTDGITRHIPDDELEQILRAEADPQTVGDIFKEMCYGRGARDNLTAIIVRMDTPSRLIAMPGKQITEASAAPETTPKGSVARFQVQLQEREGTEEREELSDLEDRRSQGATTFSSQIDRDEGLETVPKRRRVWVPVILGLALVGSFVAGIYLQPVLSPNLFSGFVSSDQPLAQRAFEEGRRAFEAGQYEAAREAFIRAVSLNPKVAAYYHWLAETQVILKEYVPGAENFWRAASLSGVADDYLHAAMAYNAAGEKEKAAEALAAAMNAKH